MFEAQTKQRTEDLFHGLTGSPFQAILSRKGAFDFPPGGLDIFNPIPYKERQAEQGVRNDP